MTDQPGTPRIGPTLNLMEMDLDARIEVLHLLQALRGARQIAYTAAKKAPELVAWYERAETTYREFTVLLGVEHEPVFDEAQHIARKLAEGDQLYIEAYGSRQP